MIFQFNIHNPLARAREIRELRATLKSAEIGRTDPAFAEFYRVTKATWEEMQQKLDLLELIDRLEEEKGRALMALEAVAKDLESHHLYPLLNECEGEDCTVCESIAAARALLQIEKEEHPNGFIQTA